MPTIICSQSMGLEVQLVPEIDYENDDKSELKRYSPGGVETVICPSYKKCKACGSDCNYRGIDPAKPCWGDVSYHSDGPSTTNNDDGETDQDAENVHAHTCIGHAKGLDNYVNEKDEDEERFANFGGTFTQYKETDKLNKRNQDDRFVSTPTSGPDQKQFT
jgi:hypothetical protein